MFENANFNHAPECDVCGVPHDEEIHEATLSVHRWFHYQVTRYLYDEQQVEEIELLESVA
jgi:hypothetical protein